MTTQRDFKRVVRSRMQKTGESYTAARAQLLRKPVTPRLETSIKPERPDARTPRLTAADYGALAGMSDAAVKKGTGCRWSSWVSALDYAGAQQWPHRAIARYVHEKYDTPGWWTQMVVVGYERIKGLRERGQQRSGEYRCSKSKTYAAPVSRVYAAFRRGQRAIRSATKNKAVRLTWPDGSSVVAGFVAKGRSKSQIAIDHSRLESKAAAERMKAYWTEQLETLLV